MLLWRPIPWSRTSRLEALQGTLRDLAQQVVALSPHVPRELRDFLGQVHEPRLLAYMVAAIARLSVAEGQQILEMESVKDKFRRLITHLTHEKEILSLRHKIQTEAREEMDKAQREYYLRQQIKAIQKELGEADESRATADDYREKIDTARLPAEAREEALRELKRLESLPPQAAEYGVIKTYLDWLVLLPWNVLSIDQLDIPHARTHPGRGSLRSARGQRPYSGIPGGAQAQCRAPSHCGRGQRDGPSCADPRGAGGHSVLCWARLASARPVWARASRAPWDASLRA